MPAFDMDTIPLPSVARALCREALRLAVPRLNRIDPGELDERFAVAMVSISAAFESVSDDSEESSFDVSNHYSYPHDASGVLAQLQSMGISADPESPEFEVAQNAPDEYFDLSLATLVIAFVSHIKEAEDNYLHDPNVDGYRLLMKEIDPCLIGLRMAIQSFATLEPALQLRKVKVSRKAGGKSGGLTAGLRFEELKAVVLDEARGRHSKESASAAALSIYQQFKDKPAYLEDEQGAPLLKDPVNRFTLWIRKDRSLTKKK